MTANREPRPPADISRERADLEERAEWMRAELRPSEEGAELSSADQHQADTATELSMREDALTRLDDLERRKADLREEERLAAEGRTPPTGAGALPAVDSDDSTPLDEVGPKPPDLASIPLARDDEDREYDPQEADDEVLPGAGLAYPTEGGAPEVGRPEEDDEELDRRYRPD